MEYQPQNNYENNYYPEQEDYGSDSGKDNTVKGLKIAIALLLAVLVVLAFLFWHRVRVDDREAQMMRDTLMSQLSGLQDNLNSMSTTNDSLNLDLEVQRGKADSLMTALKKEKSYRYSIIKKYEKELGTLRAAMQSFVHQIDSLNTVNQRLTGENIEQRRTIASLQTRVEIAEEASSELQTKVNRGQVITARDVMLKFTNNKGVAKERANKTITGLEVTFTLQANNIANPGSRVVYASVIDPNGAVITSSAKTVEIESQNVPYTESRSVDYDGKDLPVIIYCKNLSNLSKGQYKVILYMDGSIIGQGASSLK